MADSNSLSASHTANPSPSALLTGTQSPASETANAFPPFDTQYWAPQIFWLIVLFGVLYLAMSKMALPRVASILEERRQTLDGDLAGADSARRKAEDEAAAYEKLLAEARARAQADGQAKHAELAARADAERKTLETQLNEKIAAADRQIQETKSRAMANVSAIARDTASTIAEKLLGKALDPSAIDQILSDPSNS